MERFVLVKMPFCIHKYIVVFKAATNQEVLDGDWVQIPPWLNFSGSAGGVSDHA